MAKEGRKKIKGKQNKKKERWKKRERARLDIMTGNKNTHQSVVRDGAGAVYPTVLKI
jgi:hypothetical protein